MDLATRDFVASDRVAPVDICRPLQLPLLCRNYDLREVQEIIRRAICTLLAWPSLNAAYRCVRP